MAAANKTIEIWDLWYPQGGSTGVPFARGRLDATTTLIVHAPPESLTVEVRTEQGERLAYWQDLAQTADRPMARLTRRGDKIERTDTWLGESDIGRPVILPGGEVGIIQKWWNAEDGSEWRWSVEFYNHR